MTPEQPQPTRPLSFNGCPSATLWPPFGSDCKMAHRLGASDLRFDGPFAVRSVRDDPPCCTEEPGR